MIRQARARNVERVEQLAELLVQGRDRFEGLRELHDSQPKLLSGFERLDQHREMNLEGTGKLPDLLAKRLDCVARLGQLRHLQLESLDRVERSREVRKLLPEGFERAERGGDSLSERFDRLIHHGQFVELIASSPGLLEHLGHCLKDLVVTRAGLFDIGHTASLKPLGDEASSDGAPSGASETCSVDALATAAGCSTGSRSGDTFCRSFRTE